jgi:hypothetical protein
MMPRGPQGEHRPAYPIGCAIRVAKIAAREVDDIAKIPSGRVRSGRAGAKARANALPPARRQGIAKLVASSRWEGK